MHFIKLTESGTVRTLYINLNALTHFFASDDLDTGSTSTVIYLKSNILYLVQESPKEIIQLMQSYARIDIP